MSDWRIVICECNLSQMTGKSHFSESLGTLMTVFSFIYNKSILYILRALYFLYINI